LSEDRLGEFDNGDFTLSANDHIDEGFVESLVRKQGWVPSAEDDWSHGVSFFTAVATQWREIMGPVRTEMPMQRASTLSHRSVSGSRLNRGVDHHDVEVSIAQ